MNGYTDTSGAPRVKQGLSMRRAEAVAAELARDGVARQPTTIQGFGATHLKVPTGPGVREPQNERVGILIRWVAASFLTSRQFRRQLGMEE